MAKQVVWFWQRIVSPHMAGLAAAMAERDCEVVFVAERVMSEARSRQGWIPPDLGKARLELAPAASDVRALVAASPTHAIHICQGIRANGLVGVAQKVLARRGLPQWVVMETVEDTGWRGLLKRMVYCQLFMKWRGKIEGVLATGDQTPGWVVARGMPAERVFPFAYFLPDTTTSLIQSDKSAGPFRFAFVGQFIERKCLKLLVTALSEINDADFELIVVGSGPLEHELRAFSEVILQDQVRWLGRLPLDEVPTTLAQVDCLILPSRHDGWGAVVSEALMAGTPAVCSDRCGAAVVVKASGRGAVFRSGDRGDLVDKLKAMISAGPLSLTERIELMDWAKCLGAQRGAEYLQTILYHKTEKSVTLAPPWEQPSLIHSR